MADPRKLELIQPCDFELRAGVPTERPGVLRCRGCARDVHDLSAMAAADALEFLSRRRPEQCVRFLSDEDGQIHFADGPTGFIGRVARDARPMISVASLLLAGCGSEGGPQQEGAAETIAITAVATIDAASAAPTGPTASQAVVPTPSASVACVPLSASVSAAPVAGAPKGVPSKKRLVVHAGYPAD